MAQQALPSWVNKMASEATTEEKEAFVSAPTQEGGLRIMSAAIQRDQAWARVAGDLVR